MRNKNNKYILTALMLVCSVIISNAQPAARMGDMTSHGGLITIGSPTVLICGKPAARLGDYVSCPMVTPGTPPIPHVGGPIISGSATVLINGMPAARMGDMVSCHGGVSSIIIGCSTVLIGGGKGSEGEISSGESILSANWRMPIVADWTNLTSHLVGEYFGGELIKMTR
jgi:uncharacterized Zn-binding protein involved in type VI secretion